MTEQEFYRLNAKAKRAELKRLSEELVVAAQGRARAGVIAAQVSDGGSPISMIRNAIVDAVLLATDEGLDETLAIKRAILGSWAYTPPGSAARERLWALAQVVKAMGDDA